MVEKKKTTEAPSEVASEIIKRHSKAPLELYRLKDWFIRLTSNQNFFDAMLMVFAFIAKACMAPRSQRPARPPTLLNFPLVIVRWMWHVANQ